MPILNDKALWGMMMRQWLGLSFWVGTWAFGQQCAIDPLAQYLVSTTTFAPEQLVVSADEMEGDYQSALLTGNVKLDYEQHRLRTDILKYDRPSATAHAPQSALYASPNWVLQGSGLEYRASEQSASLNDAEYLLQQEHGLQRDLSQGKALRIEHQPQQTYLQHATWSSCGRINPTWQLHSDELYLDHQQNRAFAYGLRFKIKDHTIFYLPYMSYPMGNERQSGWLMPSVGSSSEQGLSLRLPYYFNLAPNYDATLTFQPMTKRGLMLGGEARYLDEHQSALARGNWLYDRHTQKNRYQFRAEHQYHHAKFQTQTLYQAISDTNYGDDFGLDGERYAENYLVREFRADLPLKKAGNVQLLFQDYLPAHKNATTYEQPFARLPQISYEYQTKWRGVPVEFRAEATQFYRADSGHSKRFDVKASAYYRWERPYGFFEPRLSVQSTHYQLSQQLGGKHHHRTLPTLSLDGGLIFEREGERYTQTLEPRLYYVYTPYRNQSALPLFDTDERHKSWAWLFMPNRFTGTDRIGDANQITTAISSRWIDNQTGQEKARYQVGQIQYLERPRTHISYNSWLNERERSLLVANIHYRFHSRLSLNALAFHNTHHGRDEYQSLDLRYEIDPKRFVQLSRRYDKDNYHQYGLSSVWKINDHYTAFARLDYSHTNRQFHNIALGFEFDDCCFSYRLIGKHYRKHPSNKEKHNAIYLEFVFKGLGAMGNQTTRLLKKEIHGFEP